MATRRTTQSEKIMPATSQKQQPLEFSSRTREILHMLEEFYEGVEMSTSGMRTEHEELSRMSECDGDLVAAVRG